MPILLQSYNIIIYSGISAPGHVREVVDGINATHKKFIFHMMATVQFPCIKLFDAQMVVHTATQNTDMSLALEFQKHFSNESHQRDIIDNGKHEKGQVKELDKQGVSCET